MIKMSAIEAIKKIDRPVFLTREIYFFCGGTLSNTTQALNHLEKKGLIIKIKKGLWGLDIGNEKLSPYMAIPFLLPSQRVYVSFISALHLHGIIEQIPQSITLASLAHTKTMHTKLGTYYFHRISPSFFKGFN
ncbi:MAG: hypothetical protein AB1498_02270 [bacterium]